MPETLQETFTSDNFRVLFTAEPQRGFAPLSVKFTNLSGDIATPIQDIAGGDYPIQDVLEA